MWLWLRWGQGFLCSYFVWQHPEPIEDKISEKCDTSIEFNNQLTKNAVLKRGESPNGWLAKLSNLCFNSSFLLSRFSLWYREKSNISRWIKKQLLTN